jgi:hypothetical protein
VIGRIHCVVASRQLMDAMENGEMKKARLAVRRGFKETILARVQRDPKFRNALLKEGFETLLAGDVDTGKAILRDYIKTTVGFEQLGVETGSSPKSLIRMSGPSGNSQARNLFAVISHLQRDAGLTLHVTARAQ